MLPKVSAALSRFVSPIQTSSPSSSSGEKPFVRTQPQGRRPSGGREQPRKDRSQEPQLSEQAQLDSEGPTSQPGVTSGGAFLQLFSALQRVKVFRWLGIRGYQAGLKSRKRAGRKGAMLDVHVD